MDFRLKIDVKIKEFTVEMLDGDPLSAFGFLLDYGSKKRAAAIVKTISFTVLSHVAGATLGAVDIPWGSSSAFGTPHYRYIRSQIWNKDDESDKFLKDYENSKNRPE